MSKTTTLSFKVDFDENNVSPAEIAEVIDRMVRDAAGREADILESYSIACLHTVCVDEQLTE